MVVDPGVPVEESFGALAELVAEGKIRLLGISECTLDELARTRVFLKVAILLCVGGTIVALSTGGDAIAQRVVVIGSGATAMTLIPAMAATAASSTRPIVSQARPPAS